MGSVALQQNSNVRPPRRGEVLAITLDVTARPYDLKGLAMAGQTQGEDVSRATSLYIEIHAVTGDVWYQFSSVTASDLDPAAAVAAGGTPAYANTYGWRVVSGTTHRVRIDRSTDRFLIMRTSSGAAIALVRAASEPFSGA